MRKLNSAATKDQSKSEDNLLPVLLRNEPGVLRTDIDTANHAVTIDFDPRVISDEGVRQVAEKLAPIGHQQYCKTILHLGGRASGAAEQKAGKEGAADRRHPPCASHVSRRRYDSDF